MRINSPTIAGQMKQEFVSWNWKLQFGFKDEMLRGLNSLWDPIEKKQDEKWWTTYGHDKIVKKIHKERK